MAKTWGYGVEAFAGGFQTGLGLGMEKSKIDALKKEQKRLEEAQEEAKRVFQEWYDSPSTKEFCANLDTASQGERAYFITGISRIREDVFKYFTEIDNDIREGNIEEAKSKNDLLEQKIKSATDLAALGMTAVFPDGSPMKISPEDIEFQKQIQIGKMAGGPTGEAIGVEMWRGRGLGEITPTPKAPGIKDYNDAWNYLYKYKDVSPEVFNKVKPGFQSQFPNIDMTDITQEALRSGVKPEVKAIPAPISLENIREEIVDAPTVEDARRIYNNGVKQYGEDVFTKSVGITDINRFWAESQIPYLDNIKTAIGNITDEKGWLKKGTITGVEVGLEGEDERPVEEFYKKLKEEYTRYRDMLEELGIDISQFPKLKSLEEIEKVGLGEGFWGIGKQKGQYKSIYYK